MNGEEFEKIFRRQFELSEQVLVEKAKEYASEGDRLHNFKAASSLIGGTPEQALWGFAVKHLVSVSDMVASGRQHPHLMWDEKIGDAINYLILLRAQVFESEKGQAAIPKNLSHPLSQGAEIDVRGEAQQDPHSLP